MKDKVAPDRLTTHSHRLIALICYLLIVTVALRRRYDLAGSFSPGFVLSLLGLFAVLYATEPLLSKRIKSYQRVYFAAQLIMVQCLGVFRDYQDTWAVLYIILGFQVALRCSRKEALAWFSLFIASLLVTLSVEFGLVSGPGRALAYIVIGVVLISYDIQYARHEDALAESQVLLVELREAHQKLAEYAARAEELATAQERNRMIQELYDSVGQKIFAIQLATEAIRLILEKDPGRAAGQIDNLQEQTQTALRQMRQLISQWQPG
jgi:signal transduction histidine kinase